MENNKVPDKMHPIGPFVASFSHSRPMESPSFGPLETTPQKSRCAFAQAPAFKFAFVAIAMASLVFVLLIASGLIFSSEIKYVGFVEVEGSLRLMGLSKKSFLAECTASLGKKGTCTYVQSDGSLLVVYFEVGDKDSLYHTQKMLHNEGIKLSNHILHTKFKDENKRLQIQLEECEKRNERNSARISQPTSPDPEIQPSVPPSVPTTPSVPITRRLIDAESISAEAPDVSAEMKRDLESETDLIERSTISNRRVATSDAETETNMIETSDAETKTDMIETSDAETQTDIIESIRKVERFQHQRNRSFSGSTTASCGGSLQCISQHEPDAEPPNSTVATSDAETQTDVIATSDAETQIDMIEPVKKVNHFQHQRRGSRSSSGSTTASNDGSLQSVSQQSSPWSGFEEAPIDDELDSIVSMDPLPEAHNSSASTGSARSRESSVDSSINGGVSHPDPFQGYRDGLDTILEVSSRSNSPTTYLHEFPTSPHPIISLGDLSKLRRQTRSLPELSKFDSRDYPTNWQRNGWYR